MSLLISNKLSPKIQHDINNKTSKSTEEKCSFFTPRNFLGSAVITSGVFLVYFLLPSRNIDTNIDKYSLLSSNLTTSNPIDNYSSSDSVLQSISSQIACVLSGVVIILGSIYIYATYAKTKIEKIDKNNSTRSLTEVLIDKNTNSKPNSVLNIKDKTVDDIQSLPIDIEVSKGNFERKISMPVFYFDTSEISRTESDDSSEIDFSDLSDEEELSTSFNDILYKIEQKTEQIFKKRNFVLNMTPKNTSRWSEVVENSCVDNLPVSDWQNLVENQRIIRESAAYFKSKGR
jgi:hypothetical protein